MQKGKVLIDVNGILGMKFNDYVVEYYQGKTYSHTKGGERARHYYLCRHKCGAYKSFQRGQILAKQKPIECVYCGVYRRRKSND